MAADMSDDDLVAQWAVITEGVARAQERVLERVEAVGTPAQWFALLHLLLDADGHRLPMSRLARDLSMTGGGLTKLADRMARDGLIDRRNSAGDRRVVYATLTDEGLRVARRTTALYRKGLREHVLDVLSPERLATLTELVNVLRDAHTPAERAGEVVRTERDPALPDRRGRGRAANSRDS